MGRWRFIWLVLVVAVALPACGAAQKSMNGDREKLVAGLEREMEMQSQWLRIHAAEALLDNGESSNKVAALFRAEAVTATTPYRIGVWRVLARATDGDERQGCVERIRGVLRDPQATDRISAAESLGKLNAVTHADREVIFEWLKTADDASAAFPRWDMVLSASSAERERDEAALAGLLDSSEPVARLRAGFALSRLNPLSTNSMTKLRAQLKQEPVDSIARVYLITALLLHERDGGAIRELEKQLATYSKGKANEQLEVGIVTGLRGLSEGIELLEPMLKSSETDGRIGAANGMLRLTR